MSKATTQSLTILSAIRSGLVTSYQDFPNVSPAFKKDLFEADELCAHAIKEWKASEKDLGRAMYCLQEWVGVLEDAGLNDTTGLTVMLAMSRQACEDLLNKVRDVEKISLLEPIIPKLDAMGGYLHDGMSDSMLIKKFELADLILGHLYKITRFEP